MLHIFGEKRSKPYNVLAYHSKFETKGFEKAAGYRRCKTSCRTGKVGQS